MKKKTVLALIVIPIVILVAASVWSNYQARQVTERCMTQPAEDTNIGGHTNLWVHIHPNLKITINGQDRVVPANVGLLPGIMRPLHTHDETGKLHVEALCLREFRLEEFFAVWGEEFTEECILGHCRNATHDITMTVDGQPSTEYGKLLLKDLQNIHIVFGPRSQEDTQ